MNIQQIRSATNKITYAGKTFLLDPWLVKKDGMGSLNAVNAIADTGFRFADPVKQAVSYPFYDLPESVESILSGVDYYIVTHLHLDHVDMAPDGTVGAPLDKAVPVIVQSKEEAEVFKRSGFQEILVLSETEPLVLGEASLIKTPARHGFIKKSMEAMGVIFQSQQEKTLYVSGDTVWFEGVRETLEKYKPDVITVNGAAAYLKDCGRLIMNDEDVEAVAKTMPEAKIFITHMDNVPHAGLTRVDMRANLLRRGITDFYMPDDGETVSF